MKTLNDIQNVNSNAANVASNNNKIDDFGQKIGGARKDLYQAANEWAAQLADITAEALTKAGGVSKLVRLPNLEKLTEAGAITADQARGALVIWRGLERKPSGSYRANLWAERTRARLEAVAAVLTQKPAEAEAVADIMAAAVKSPELEVLRAANWPAEAFTFGKYSVARYRYSDGEKLSIRETYGGASADPADIVRQLRELVARDQERAAERREAGPRLDIYHTSDGTRYFIAVANKCEIVLRVCDTYQEAREAVRNDRAALLERYEALRTFPALRRSWNRPRVGKEWHAEDVTPEQFAAAIPFKGVEFGNWLNQNERAALLNSAFDGFHDLADLLGIPAEAVALGGRLNFSFATRGTANSAAHFNPCYNTINLNKRNGAGCMAHEWLHAADHFAAVLAGRGGCGSYSAAFATESNAEPTNDADRTARAIIAAIKKQDFYTRSQNYQRITGKSQGGEDYYTQPCELAARGFEGVVLYLLTKAGQCSDFLVNLESWKAFETNDAGHRRDCYPYPSDNEAAALLPYYIDFFRALFGACQVSKEAAEGVAAATIAAAEEKAEADRRAAEKAARAAEEAAARRAELLKEMEKKAAESAAKAAAEAEALRERAARAVELLRDVLTARHFDEIATGYDSATAYAVAHLEGEIYTMSADIKTADSEGRAYVANRPAACIQYKRVHNAKRIICHRYPVATIKANKWNAADLVKSLDGADVRQVVKVFESTESGETWRKAADLWNATQRLHEEQAARAQKAAEMAAERETAAEGTNTKPEAIETADGLTMEQYSEKATVIRGYNADQLAELLEMGGKEWHRLKGGKGVIFSTRRHADKLAEWMKAQQGEGTAPAAAAADSESKPETIEAAPASLETPAEITATAVVVPEWLKVGARVRTAGRYMMSNHSRRPVWVEGEEMTVKEIKADFVELESRDEAGNLRGLSSVATAAAADLLTPLETPAEIEAPAIAASEPTAAERLGEAAREYFANEYKATHHGASLTEWDKAHPAPVEWCKPGQVFKLSHPANGGDVYAIITKLGNDCFFFVANVGNQSEHLTAYNCQQWDNLQPVEVMHEDTPKFAKMFAKFHKIREAWEAEGVKVWEERERKENAEPLAVAASYDTESDTAETINTPTRAKAYTYQDQPAADTLPEDLPAELLKFYEVNREATEDNPAPVCLFYEPGVKKYQAFGSDAHLLSNEFGAAVITFTQETEYKHGKKFPHPIDFADFPADELPARLLWLTREGYAVAVFAFADCLPTLSPAAPNWQERDKERRALRYSERLELGDGVTRVMESERNMYDFHYDLYYRYYKGGDLLAMFHATGYPEKWDYIGTIRPPHAGRFSNGAMVEHFGTIWQAERYMLAEIAKGLQPYNKPTDPTPAEGDGGAVVCNSYETAEPTTLQTVGEISDPTADPLADIISEAKKQESRTASGLNYGPIKYLRCHVLYADNGKTTAENMKEYEANLHRVTDPSTYAAYLIAGFDVFVDETQVFCDLRRVFPSLTFQELCKLINDNMGENQQGDGIAAALVPDCVILASADDYTRRQFKERHDRYNSRRADEKDGYNGQQWARWYDRESLALHLLLSEELFYIWESRRAARALDYLQESYPDATADDLQAVFMKYADGVTAIYG